MGGLKACPDGLGHLFRDKVPQSGRLSAVGGWLGGLGGRCNRYLGLRFFGGFPYSHSHDEQVGKGNTGMKKLVADWAKRAAFKHHEEQMAGKLIASSTDLLVSRQARQQHQLPHCQEARPFQVIWSQKHLFLLLNSTHLFHTSGNLRFEHFESRTKFVL